MLIITQSGMKIYIWKIDASTIDTKKNKKIKNVSHKENKLFSINASKSFNSNVIDRK